MSTTPDKAMSGRISSKRLSISRTTRDSGNSVSRTMMQSVVGGPFFQGQNLKYCNQIRRILEMAFACAFASRITLIAINSLCVIFACIVIYYGSAGKSKCDLQSINCHFQIALDHSDPYGFSLAYISFFPHQEMFMP